MPSGWSYFTVVAIEASLFLTRVYTMTIYYGRSDPPLMPRVEFLLQIRHISYLFQENTEDILSMKTIYLVKLFWAVFSCFCQYCAALIVSSFYLADGDVVLAWSSSLWPKIALWTSPTACLASYFTLCRWASVSLSLSSANYTARAECF